MQRRARIHSLAPDGTAGLAGFRVAAGPQDQRDEGEGADDACSGRRPAIPAWSGKRRQHDPSLSPSRDPPCFRPTLWAMSRSLLERKLSEVTERLRLQREELAVAEEQLAFFMEGADDARLRALVSETPLADREHHEAQRHADAMARHRNRLVEQITELESVQDRLLERFVTEID